ncbi:MAG: hypothetical protein U1E60_18975 [Reyranellaceae bacterium]
MNINPARLLAKKTVQPMTHAEPETSEAHRLAGQVRRPAAHQVLEARLSELRNRAAELRQRMVDLRVGASAANERQTDSAIKTVSAEMEANDAALRACRRELVPHRQRHSLAVEDALKSMRKQAAEKAVAAAESLEEILAELNEMADAARLHGVDAPPIRLQDLDALEDLLKGLL